MLVLGLTGNIAAGKSAVAARLAALGAPVVDADLLAREAVAPGTPALDAVVARFGPSVLATNGELDRAALRAIVFADATAREALNAIVHPEVDRLRRAALERHRAAGAAIVVCDIPLLFEAGLEGAVDRIILVDAPAALRRERLIRDRGLSPAEADAMIAAQMPAELKRPKSHYVLDNGGSREALDAQVDALWAELNA
jgi:dephospho-CoA kinase